MTVGLLALLCAVVAVFQYRWIGEISETERDRLEVALRERLAVVQRDFNEELRDAASAVVPTNEEIADAGRDAAYEDRFVRSGSDILFSEIALAIPQGAELALKQLNFRNGRFAPAAWPEKWNRTYEYLRAKMDAGQSSGSNEPDPMVIEIPRFGGEGPDRREQEWLLLELDANYLKTKLLPSLVRRELPDYDVQIVTRAQGEFETIYESSAGLRLSDQSDASVTLLESGPTLQRRQGPGGPKGRAKDRGPRGKRFDDRKAKGERFDGRFDDGGPKGPPPPSNGPGGGNEGRWLLLARNHSGSLDALVQQTRRRNLLLSGGLLLLILGTAAALVRYSRQAEQLAEMRMNFVAGVSHELKTPLTVIRTAAFNLRGKLAHNPDHVERYGRLIQSEAERLSALVEQVLQFANARANTILKKVEPLMVADLFERSLEAAQVRSNPSLVVETDVPVDLPMVLGDRIALTHALENLMDNAVKHGAAVAGSVREETESWLGLSARAVLERSREFVEISVADRGPGIPPEEQATIFEPFQRGSRAITDQVRGTGLGLDLVKKIVEAHGGTIRVQSEPLKRTEFIMRIPAAPKNASVAGIETANEFAHPSH
jgi:signal transduction histidine kinase